MHVRASQEVIHLSNAPARARLISEFLWDVKPYDFKTHHVELIRDLTYKPNVMSWIFFDAGLAETPFEVRG